MKLTDYLDLLAHDIAFWMAGAMDPDYDLPQLGNLGVELSGKLRAAAIIVLLTKADSDAFCHNLIRSGRCREIYLRRLNAAGITDDHHQGSGRFNAFLDAIAADDFALARSIADLSPTTWHQGHEYEDDFCYAQILSGLIARSRDAQALEALLKRFEAVLNGEPEPRLDIVRAIAANDHAGFEIAFESLLARHADQIEQDKARHKLEDAEVIAERQILVEGVALLRIAERLGFPLQAEYRFCPSLARQRMRRPFPGE
jgi:hypothetical protein